MQHTPQHTRSARLCAVLLAACLGTSVLPAVAAPPPDIASTHPFAKHFLALQISSTNKDRQAHITSVAANLLKHYGQDAIAIEVVAFGPGVRLLYADSPAREQVESLINEGVRFDACGNTLDTIERTTGKRPKLIPGVIVVPVGVARLLTLAEHGFTIVQP